MTNNNPIFTWDQTLGLPAFSKISDDDYRDAFDSAMATNNEEVDLIANSPDAATFENTIVTLERAGDKLSKVNALFWNRAGAHTNDVIKTLERDIGPKLSRHHSKIAANASLFAKINTIYQNRNNLKLSTEQLRVLKKYWRSFVHSGANLAKDEQERLAVINEKLASLGTSFGQNVLNDESTWVMVLNEKSHLNGLPTFLLDAMSEAANERGYKGNYVVTLSRSIIEPFLTFSTQRDLREKAFLAWTSRGENGGETDNKAIIREILLLRQEMAKLLGYKNFADFKLEDTMAKSATAVEALLMKVWDKARVLAKAEERDLEELIQEEGHNHKIAPADWRFYAEKQRAKKFNFSEAELKPYLQLEKIIDACFETAERLFGLKIMEKQNIDSYHPDVRTFAVSKADGTLIGVFLGDYFARASKRSGAWMSAFQVAKNIDRPVLPIIYNVMNFAKPAKGKPALLSMDDARTLFHEFGHALHGLLSKATYPSVSGTAVSRDFVELPSQLFEHWLTVPETLEKHAVHVETGKPMPKELLDKVLAAQTFNAGFQTVEFTSSALVDMALHTNPSIDCPPTFEKEKLAELNMPSAITMRHRSSHFLHIFSGGGYAAGYYSYMWSEVLDADAFEAFNERGNPFDTQTAKKLMDNIYATGDTIDPEKAYLAFRGKMPSPDAMMRGRGLL